ncbi:MAG: CRTAC1 family protein [Planctomycetota bacterium]
MIALLLLLASDFTNVALEVGIPDVPSGRAVFVDLDGDGKLDIVLDRKTVLMQRDGKFIESGGFPYQPGTILFADFDNDGDVDAFAGEFCEPDNPKWKDHERENALFVQNEGRWSFQKLKMPRTSVHAVCTFDQDQDGILDVFIGSGYQVYGQSLASHADRLFRGDGKGRFNDVSEALGLLTRPTAGSWDSSKPTYGVTHGDFNNDGFQDIWVCTYGRQWNSLWVTYKEQLYTNLAPRIGFDGDDDLSGAYPGWLKEFWKEKYGRERDDEPPFRSNGNTFDCAIADYDNDGDLDCILAEITHAWAGTSSDLTSLLVNENGRFRRVVFPRMREGNRWNQGDIHCGWIDYDNDGLQDALIASSDYPDRQELKLYRQKPDHTFEEARLFDWEGAAQISVGDFDNDGDLDILCGRSLNRLPKERREALGKRAALFRNDVGNKNRWLQVVCEGTKSNRDGIGCRILVTTPDGVTQLREIRGGHGHAGHNNPYIAHFGLGQAETVKIVVRWPHRDVPETVIEGVKANQRLVVREGANR